MFLSREHGRALYNQTIKLLPTGAASKSKQSWPATIRRRQNFYVNHVLISSIFGTPDGIPASVLLRRTVMRR